MDKVSFHIPTTALSHYLSRSKKKTLTRRPSKTWKGRSGGEKPNPNAEKKKEVIPVFFFLSSSQIFFFQNDVNHDSRATVYFVNSCWTAVCKDFLQSNILEGFSIEPNLGDDGHGWTWGPTVVWFGSDNTGFHTWK